MSLSARRVWGKIRGGRAVIVSGRDVQEGRGRGNTFWEADLRIGFPVFRGVLVSRRLGIRFRGDFILSRGM